MAPLGQQPDPEQQLQQQARPLGPVSYGVSNEVWGFRCLQTLILTAFRLESSNVAQYGPQYGSFDARPAYQDTMS